MPRPHVGNATLLVQKHLAIEDGVVFRIGGGCLLLFAAIGRVVVFVGIRFFGILIELLGGKYE